MAEAYIIDGVRTPIGKFLGTLSPVRADDLLALTLKEILKRNPSIDPNKIEDVLIGCTNQGGDDNRNVARMSSLLAGLPETVPGITVNRLCASGMSATVEAARGIQLGDGDLYISGGVESMTRAPYALSKSAMPFGRDAKLFDTSFGWRFINPKMEELFGTESMGQTAENVAEKYQISRADQDQFAMNSQQKAGKAQESGRFEKEIVPVEIPQRKKDPIIFKEDEFIRSSTNLESLAKLKPAFRKDGKGSVTAGNASGLNDGASAVLLASEQAVKEYSLKPQARVVSSAVVGLSPSYMGMGPVKASQKALAKAGLKIEQMDVIELNEAFAAQSLACIRELGLADDDPRINPNGGAIALGHPLGMSGARIVATAALELELRQARYALCTMCIGVGQGKAIILERV